MDLVMKNQAQNDLRSYNQLTPDKDKLNAINIIVHFSNINKSPWSKL